MAFGIPVIARDIPGNNYIINDTTGFLFQTADEFTRIVNQLISNESKWSEVSKNSQEYIKVHHNIMNEKLFYQKMIQTIPLPK